MVVMQNHESGGLRGCGYEQVGDLGTALLALTGKRVLNIDGSIQNGLIHRDERPRRSRRPHRPM